MSIKDLTQASYADAERAYKESWIDQTDWDLYRFYWRNGAFRFSEIASEFELKEGL